MLELLKRLFARRPAAPRALAPPPSPPPRPPEPPREVSPAEPNGLMTLERVLRAHEGRLPAAAALQLARRLCELLASASTPLGGLDHADVRFLASGQVVICSPFAALPRSERLLRGSYWHLSPEQVLGLPLDARSDVFNVATVLYEWLEGGRLFGGDSDFAMLEAVRQARLPDHARRIPSELLVVLRRALAARREARFQTVLELHAALGPFVEGADPGALDELVRPLLSAPPLPPEPPPSPAVPALESESARLVYADWLEEHGKPLEASWLRKDSALRAVEGSALERAIEELRELSAKVPREFLASVARPAVEGCPIRFGFKCPLQWDAMRRTEREGVRHCTGCRQDVHYCRTLEEAQLHTLRGACVALDPSLVRTEGDLDPVPRANYVGRLA